MKIIIGSDHAGFELKEEVKTYLESLKYEVIDVGTFNKESVDYPIYGKEIGHKVRETANSYGIAICGTGIGISIAANKVKGIRCANVNSIELAKLAREHNDANVLALGARFIDKDLAFKVIDVFLSTPFSNGRHCKRVEMLNESVE